MCSCPHCGEPYFTAETMHEIERIKTLRKSVAVSRDGRVAAFTGNVPMGRFTGRAESGAPVSLVRCRRR